MVIRFNFDYQRCAWVKFINLDHRDFFSQESRFIFQTGRFIGIKFELNFSFNYAKVQINAVHSVSKDWHRSQADLFYFIKTSFL